ncbi:MAG: hypothetical protein HC800_11265 [Phormidesmis sp. RL_2_1]|nr:hypothetical protein [Phormidesmis sp. RL_2_1]
MIPNLRFCRWMLFLWVLIAFEGAAASPAMALVDEDHLAPLMTAQSSESMPLGQSDESTEVTRYADDSMSVDYPATWEIQVGNSDVTITHTAASALDVVETKIFRIDSPPGAVVNANIDSFIEEGAAVGPYRTVTIDGQDALMMWLFDRPNELPAAIATFIGYGNETILLFSRYAPTAANVEADILRLHESFKNLAANNTAINEATSPDATSSEVMSPEVMSPEVMSPESTNVDQPQE